MQRADTQERRLLAAVALGNEPADLIVRGGRVLSVYSGIVDHKDVAIKGDRIAAVGEVGYAAGPETDYVDAGDRILVPGFIDTHIHIGNGQLPVAGLAQLLVARGTAAICTCLIETAWLAGRSGIELALEQARATPLQVLMSPFAACHLVGRDENNSALGLAEFTDDDLRALLELPATVEVREWSVLEELRAAGGAEHEHGEHFIDLARRLGLRLSGHLEGLSPRELQASAALGVTSDHEATTIADVLARIDLGIHVQIREGSVAHDLTRLVPAITDHGADPRMFSFCTDDNLSDTLVRDGHIDHRIRSAVAQGLDPIDAIRMATLNAAEFLRVSADLGSITPGKRAHLNLVPDLASCTVETVVVGSKIVAQQGRYCGAAVTPSYPEHYRTTVRHDPVTPDSFVVRLDSTTGTSRIRVIHVVPDTLITAEVVREVDNSPGQIFADPSADVIKLAVIDRHVSGDPEIGLGLVSGLGLARGAFAATFNPGLMNLMVAGVSDKDMAVAANRVRELQGGVVAALDGRIIAELPLPLLGIFSDLPATIVAERMADVTRAVREELGSGSVDTIALSAFVTCLASIPSLRLSTTGLVDVSRHGGVAEVGLVITP